jgi:hypothetical protein
MLEGYKLRTDHQHELAAWVVHWLLAPHSPKGKPPTIDELLGRTQKASVQLPNGLTATGDPGLIAALIGDNSSDAERSKFEQLWVKVQKQREASQ